jgi:tetratricopeptide (TPR) repeat protein
MQRGYEFRISRAAIRTFSLGTPVFTLRQLEQQLWHEMRYIFNVRRSEFRRAAGDLRWHPNELERPTCRTEDLQADAGGSCQTIRRTLFLSPLELLQEFVNHSSSNPSLVPASAKAYLSLGNASRELGNVQEAILAYHNALDRAEQLGCDFPATAEYQLLRIDAQLGLVRAHQDLQLFPKAEGACRKALHIAEELAGRHPYDAFIHAALADVQIQRAGLHAQTGQDRQMFFYNRQYLATRGKIKHLQPSLESRAYAPLSNRDELLEMNRGNGWLHMAAEALSTACEGWRRINNNRVEMPDFDDKLIGALAALEVLYPQNRQANPDADAEQVLEDDAHYAWFQYKLALSYEDISFLDPARNAYGKSIAAFDMLVRSRPDERKDQFGLSLAQRGLGRVAWKTAPEAVIWKPCLAKASRTGVALTASSAKGGG